MWINKKDFWIAVSEVGIEKKQNEKLWKVLENKAEASSKFSLHNVLFYLGAMIIIAAMGWMVGSNWEKLGGKGILIIALSYMLTFFLAGNVLWKKEQFKTVGGLFITVVVCLVPLAIYGFQRSTGMWLFEDPGKYSDFRYWIRSGWFIMEIGTIVASIVALRFYRFTFLTMPLFFTLWFLSMDITPIIYGKTGYLWDERLMVSLWFGLMLLAVSFYIDLHTKQGFAFWGYIFGMITFWFGLSLLDSDSEFKKFIYFMINIGLILFSIWVRRVIFLLFGVIGFFLYITGELNKFFHNDVVYPFILTFIGLTIVTLGMLCSKKGKDFLNFLPDKITKWRPKNRS